MTQDSSMEGTSLNQVIHDSPDSTIGINIKTLDSQIYSFSVKKNMPVPALKEEIVTTIGVPLEQQRLIYRGKVLKDDQLLSDHCVEDGDTLHLVVRPEVQSQPTSSTANSNISGFTGQANDSGPGLQHARVGQVAHSIFLGTVNIGDRNGEALPVDLGQIVPAVLNLLGAQNIGATGGFSAAPVVSASNQTHASAGTQSSLNHSRTQAVNSASGGFIFPNQPVPLSTQFTQLPSVGTTNQPLLPSVGTVNQQLVIADALTTLSEFIDRMQGVLQSSNYSLNDGQNQPYSATPSLDSRGLPTPEFFRVVLERTQLLLRDNATAALSHVSTRLQREGNSSDPLLRGQIQTEAMQLGVAMQHLGALLLELGRVTMTLRMGQTPAESSVYAGPAVYISPAGPNPIMVQPFPFQASSLFGISAPQSVPDLSTHGAPRDSSSNINIHLHAGSSVSLGVSSNGSIASSESIHAHLNTEQAAADRNGLSESIPTRGLPSRRITAALQARAVPEGSGQVLSVVYPLHVRTQQSVPIRSASQVFSTTASRGGQPHEQNMVPLPPLGSDSLPILVAEITARIPMLPSGNSPVQSSSMQSSATDGSYGAVYSDAQSDMPSLTLQPPEVHSGILHTTGLNVERNSALSSDSQSQIAISRLETVGSSNREDNGLCSPEDLHLGNDACVESQKVVGADVSKRSGSDENDVPDLTVSRIVEQQVQLKDDQSDFMDSGEISEMPFDTNSASSPANFQSSSIPSYSSEINSFEGEPDSFGARQSLPLNKTIETQTSAPLGLGIGSLQTKRRNKSIKSKGKGDGQTKASSSDQDSFSRGNEALYSLAAQPSHVDRENTNESSSQFPSLISEIINSMPLGGEAGSGQTDFAGMMANAMQSSGFSNLLSGVASHSRVPTGDLRSLLEHCVQNPAVQNTFNQIVQQAGQNGDQLSNSGTVQGRFDFKGMIQQMLPAVSLALSKPSTSSMSVSDIKSEPQPESNDDQTSAMETLTDNDNLVDVCRALETIEQNDDPRNILEALLRISGRLYGEKTNYQDIVELGNDEELAREFIEVLKRDILHRLAEESKSSDKS